MADAAGLEKINLMQGRFHIFQRVNSPYWWCGFHHNGKYIRESSKEKNRSVAEAFAEKWYFKKQLQIEGGELVTSTKSFGSVAKNALVRYQEKVNRGERSGQTLKSINIVLNARVMPFFEKKPIESITNQSWFEFKDDCYEKYPDIKRGTLHQLRIPRHRDR